MQRLYRPLETIHHAVGALRPKEEVSGDVPNIYYEKDLNPTNFTDIDAVILDESVVVDIITKRTRRRNINGTRDYLSSGYKTLEMLNEVTRRNQLESGGLDVYYVTENCKYHPNGTEPDTIGRYLLTSIHEKLGDIGTELDLSEVTGPAPEKWENYGRNDIDLSEDWRIGQLAEEYNAMVVATDTDFQEIAQENDFVAMTPDLAELGFRAANDQIEDTVTPSQKPF